VKIFAVSLVLATGCAGALGGAGVSLVAPHTVQRPEYGTCLEAGGKIDLPRVGYVTQLTSTCFRAADAAIDPVQDAGSTAPICDKEDGGCP
jgi:hypothetical protein